MAQSNVCPRCTARCVVAARAEVSCLACGHELRPLPMWLATTPSEPLPLTPPDSFGARFEDEEDERIAR